MAKTFKPKVCDSCGNEFVPNSGVQKRCEECRKTHVVPSQTNEYRNAYRRKKRAAEGKPVRKPGRPRNKAQAANHPNPLHIGKPDPTRATEKPTKKQAEIDRIGNTELGSRLRARMYEIEQESFDRFHAEKGD